MWEAHYARLRGSAARLGWVAPESCLLKGQLVAVLEANRVRKARVRITLGQSCLITAEPLPRVEGDLTVVSIPGPVNERSPLAGIKCTSYAENVLLLRESGADEAIRPNTVGELCEGCLSNVFFVKEGEIFTPAIDTGCLPGVMRAEVIRLAPVREGRWPLEVIDEAEEVWLSNSLRRLRYVNRLNGRDLGRESSLFAEVSQHLVARTQ